MGIKERRLREKNLRREAIISAAEQLFFLKGVEQTTMDEIAAAAELAKGTLYLYFSRKEDLSYAVAEKSIGIMNNMAAVVPEMPINSIEKLIALGNILIEFAHAYPERFKMLVLLKDVDIPNMSLSKEQIHDSIYKNSPVRYVYDFVRAGIKEKIIRNDIPAEIIANTLWSQMFGVVQFAFLKSGVYELAGFSSDQLFENHMEIVLNGIKA
jgi:AcrR family transcriptional regulator